MHTKIAFSIQWLFYDQKDGVVIGSQVDPLFAYIYLFQILSIIA